MGDIDDHAVAVIGLNQFAPEGGQSFVNIVGAAAANSVPVVVNQKAVAEAQLVQTQDHYRPLGDSKPTCGPLPAASGLSLAGFFLTLFEPMFRMGGHPAIRQQGFEGSSVIDGGENQVLGLPLAAD